MVNLDTLTFHECVNTTEFDDSKILTIRPPEGEVRESCVFIVYRLRDPNEESLLAQLYR